MVLKKEAEGDGSVNRDKRNDSSGTGTTEGGAAPSPRCAENRSPRARGAAGEISSGCNVRSLPQEKG